MGTILSGQTPVRRYRLLKQPVYIADALKKAPFEALEPEGTGNIRVGFSPVSQTVKKQTSTLDIDQGQIIPFRVEVSRRASADSKERKRLLQDLVDGGMQQKDAEREIQEWEEKNRRIITYSNYDMVIRGEHLYCLNTDPGQALERLFALGFEAEPLYPWHLLDALKHPLVKLDRGSWHGANLGRSCLYYDEPHFTGQLSMTCEDHGKADVTVKGSLHSILPMLKAGSGTYSKGLPRKATLDVNGWPVTWNFLSHSIAAFNPKTSQTDAGARLVDRVNAIEKVFALMDGFWNRHRDESDEDKSTRHYLQPGAVQADMFTKEETHTEPPAEDVAEIDDEPEEPTEPPKPLVTAGEHETMIPAVADEFEPVGNPGQKETGVFGRLISWGRKGKGK